MLNEATLSASLSSKKGKIFLVQIEPTDVGRISISSHLVDLSSADIVHTKSVPPNYCAGSGQYGLLVDQHAT